MRKPFMASKAGLYRAERYVDSWCREALRVHVR